jgi:hypothetical protein
MQSRNFVPKGKGLTRCAAVMHPGGPRRGTEQVELINHSKPLHGCKQPNSQSRQTSVSRPLTEVPSYLCTPYLKPWRAKIRIA